MRIEFTERFINVIEEIGYEDNYVAFELSWFWEEDFDYRNPLKIEKIDTGATNKSTDYNFVATINGVQEKIKIGKFLRTYFKNIFNKKDIEDFTQKYNAIKNGKTPSDVISKPVIVGDFKYNPKDVRSTFLSLTTKTYPYGNEEQVLQFLPKGLKKDEHGNYYTIIKGDDTTMFTSHLDTADRRQVKTNIYSKTDNGDEILFTDKTSILGADDKAGVTVMLYMLEHKVPGIYYFFIGEERGGIGSNAVSGSYNKYPHLKNVKKCISFDRRNTTSVITHQLGGRCCSDKFATDLCKAYNSQGLNLSLDNGGVYTDSASFMNDIGECTNVSVGYMNEHTGDETQNITYLEKLCKASVNVDWQKLEIGRKVGVDDEIIEKYKDLIDDLNKCKFECPVKTFGVDGQSFISIELLDMDISELYTDLVSLKRIVDKHNLDDMCLFLDTNILIELK
jgi:hypothetical protein